MNKPVPKLIIDNSIHVYDLKSLRKQRVLTAKIKAANNLKNGWDNSDENIIKKFKIHKIKKVIRNNLPIKIRNEAI